MSNYIKSTDFAVKDGLLTGNPLKTVSGTEINDEYNAIQTAVGTKANTLSPTLTGAPLSPTAAIGTNTTQIATTAFVTNHITAPTAAAGTNTTQIATTAFVTASQGTIASQDSDAVAITGGTITGITDLTVADGGTGASTHTANSVLIGEGTSAISSVAPGTSGNVLTSNGTNWASTTHKSIGVDQTWQDVTSTRDAGVTYTNSTGSPIQVAIAVYRVASAGTTFMVINGLNVGRWSTTGTNDVGTTQTQTYIIPNGVTYSLSGGSGTDTSWFELR